MNPIKYTLILIFFVLSFFPQAQNLNFELHNQNGIYTGTVKPDYFDSIMLNPSKVKDNPLLHATGILYNAEHGNFNFKITKNIIDNSTALLFKVSFGWFPINNLDFDENQLKFSWDWDYRPPPNPTGLKILQRADEILKDEASWDNKDDRKCENDRQNQKWSLYCALYLASFDVIKDFNHRNSAMEMVRKTIEEMNPNKKYRHRLMDFNNEESFEEVKSILALSINKFEEVLSK